MTQKKFLVVLTAALFVSLFLPATSHARSEGYFLGGGYNQPLMFTWKDQGSYSTTPGDSISLWPSAGAFMEFGYEFGKPDWLGLSMPISWSFVRVNKNEWSQLFNGDVEALFHLSDVEKKFDPFVGLLAGFTYLTEGKTSNQSKSYGPDFGVSFGCRYSLMEYTRGNSPVTTNLSLSVEIPVKIVLFLNDQYFTNNTTAPFIAVPFRLGVNYKF